tara:strand:+ start:7465 stop:8079 length:615 start_codon:yes stop_codon:yes gene_type:complete
MQQKIWPTFVDFGLVDRDYTFLKNFISKEESQLAYYYSLIKAINPSETEDSQSPGWDIRSNDPIGLALLYKVKKKMEAYANKKLFPTYCYYRVYKQGSVLLPHTDRPSCEYSATVCLGYNNSNIPNYNWPFRVGKEMFMMQPGDAVLYKGCDVTHSRVGKYGGIAQTQIFLHYVDAEGPFKDFKHDKKCGTECLLCEIEERSLL